MNVFMHGPDLKVWDPVSAAEAGYSTGKRSWRQVMTARMPRKDKCVKQGSKVPTPQRDIVTELVPHDLQGWRPWRLVPVALCQMPSAIPSVVAC